MSSKLNGSPDARVGPFSKPILIIGFHNSGARLLAKLLKEMGVFQVVDRQSFEWGYIQDLNSSILPKWNDPEAIRRLDSRQDIFHLSTSEIAEMLEEYGYNNDQPWGHKDPRNCVTLGVWLAAFPEAKVVHIVRDPVDALGTLAAEYDEFTPEGKLPQKALSFWGDLWMAYTDSILQTADKAKRFVEIRFEDLCLHPHHVLLNLAHMLNLSEGKTVNLESIQPGKVGIHRQWILQGKLDVMSVDRLKIQLKDYRRKYGYDKTTGTKLAGVRSRESCFDRILTPVF